MTQRRASLSVVIPALNEETSISRTIRSVEDADEVIVVDGGSSDRTCSLARELGARTHTTPASRGLQLAEGARLSRGEWVLFLHADTWLDRGACAAIRSFDSSVAGGAFRLRFDSPQVVYRVIETGARLRTRLFRLPYGDQAIFCRRSAYEAAGGIPPLPIMEDVAFIRALARTGSLAFPAIDAVTSVRRYRRRGPLLSATSNLILLARYLAGADVDRLARAYRR